MDLAALIKEVREMVHDPKPDHQYEDETYKRAATRGISVLNIDLDQTYTISTLPVKLNILLTYRTACEMCNIRAGAAGGSSSLVEVSTGNVVRRIEVPQLEVEFQSGTVKGAAYWEDHCHKYEEEYERLLDKIITTDDDTGSGVKQSEALIINRRMGIVTPHRLVTPLDAADIAISLDATDTIVTVSWDIERRYDFGSYLIQRDIVDTFTDPTDLISISDPQVINTTDEPGSGTWYYRVVKRTLNAVNTNSIAAEQVVP
jgi:hypothetical protein